MTDQHQTEAQRLAALLRSRNNQAGFGLGPVCDEAALELLRLNAVHADLERVNMQLVACGVVAMADTPDSVKKARAMHPDYESASCDDVKRRVDECIELRARVAELEAQLEFIGSRGGQFPDMVTLPRIVVEQALEAFDCIHSPLLIREIIKIGAEKAKLRAALEQPQGEQPLRYLDGGSRYKVTHLKTSGYCIIGLPEELLGRWVALVDATDNKHMDSHQQPSAAKQPQDHVPDAGNMAPTGWKLVPLEPTDAMLGAGLRHVDGMTSMPSAYRDMLAAAPQPPVVEQQQVEQEPAAWLAKNSGPRDWGSVECGDTPLYTHPQNLRCKSNQARLATLWGYEKEQPKREPMPPQADTPLTQEQLTVFKYGWKCAESAHGIGGKQ